MLRDNAVPLKGVCMADLDAVLEQLKKERERAVGELRQLEKAIAELSKVTVRSSPDLIWFPETHETPTVGGSPRAHRGSAKSALGEGARAVQQSIVSCKEQRTKSRRRQSGKEFVLPGDCAGFFLQGKLPRSGMRDQSAATGWIAGSSDGRRRGARFEGRPASRIL